MLKFAHIKKIMYLCIVISNKHVQLKKFNANER